MMHLEKAASCKLSMKTKIKILNTELPNSELYIYDLGKMWHKLTGKPFVFALWIVRGMRRYPKGL